MYIDVVAFSFHCKHSLALVLTNLINMTGHLCNWNNTTYCIKKANYPESLLSRVSQQKLFELYLLCHQGLLFLALSHNLSKTFLFQASHLQTVKKIIKRTVGWYRAYRFCVLKFHDLIFQDFPGPYKIKSWWQHRQVVGHLTKIKTRILFCLRKDLIFQDFPWRVHISQDF